MSEARRESLLRTHLAVLGHSVTRGTPPIVFRFHSLPHSSRGGESETHPSLKTERTGRPHSEFDQNSSLRVLVFRCHTRQLFYVYLLRKKTYFADFNEHFDPPKLVFELSNFSKNIENRGSTACGTRRPVQVQQASKLHC